jgi:hypothetical protein
MRRTEVLLALILGLLALGLAGCPRKAAPSSAPQTSQAGPAATPADQAPPEDPRATIEELAEGDFGLYSDPGDVPPVEPEDGALCKYADLDGDGQREALAVLKTYSDEEKADVAALGIGRWDGDEWQLDIAITASEGETEFDQDSLILAYDMDQDGITEIGITFYETQEHGRGTNLYVYKLVDGELKLVLDPATVATLGAITWGNLDDAAIDDVTDQFPGDELIVTGRDKSITEPGPSQFYMDIYAWANGKLGPYLSYATDEEFEDAGSAMEAFVNGEGGYWLDMYDGNLYDPEKDDRWDPDRFKKEDTE